MNEKTIKKLHDKKYRQALGLFLVQGEKCVDELLASDFETVALFSTHMYKPHAVPRVPITYISEPELRALGTLESNTTALAVAKQKSPIELKDALKDTGHILMLDTIRDPGNLGTILRTADWFGIHTVVCSPTTVDVYNPKAISATMGAFTRARCIYTSLTETAHILQEHRIALYGCVMDGEDLYTVKKNTRRCIVMGSESHGITPELESLLTYRVTIPKKGAGAGESLNVAVAAGIALSVLS